MKTNICALSALLFICAIAACNPKTAGVTSSNLRKLSRVEFSDDTTFTINLFYNDKGDISKMYNGTDTVLYTYAGDSIHLDWTDGQGMIVATQKIRTNDAGKVISNHILDPSGTLYSYSQYEYHADGRMMKHTRHNMRTNDVFTMDYHYSGGNIDHVVISRNGEAIDKFVYEYDTTKANKFELDLENLTNDYFTNGRMGTGNKHLMSRAYRINPIGDTTTLRHFTYELDKDGYVVKRTDVDGLSEYSSERNFTYQ